MRAAADKLRLSEIAPGLVQSEIRAMSLECERVGGVNLAQGVCDTEVPQPVTARAIEAIAQGLNIYTRLDGIAPLRQAIAARVARYNGIHADPESEILVTSGATAGFYAACMALFNPGDEVILFEPFYGYHLNTLSALRVKAVSVPLAAPGWTMDFDDLRAAITPRTRGIIVNSPSNPCGKVFSRAEFEAIAALALEHDLFVITDEIYEYFVYEGAHHISPATLPGMAERTITISGLSKTFSITGWRVGTSSRTVAGSEPSLTSTTSSTSAPRRPFSTEQPLDSCSFPTASTRASPSIIRRSATCSAPHSLTSASPRPSPRVPTTSSPMSAAYPAPMPAKKRAISSARPELPR